MHSGDRVTNKKLLSERDICTKYITPALQKAGWDIQAQVREEVVLDSNIGSMTEFKQIIGRGTRINEQNR